MSNLYIALIRADEFCSEYRWPGGLAVYYDPGSISLESHESLSYCFLEYIEYSPYPALTVCSRDHSSITPESADEAIRLLDQERRRLEANLPDGWSDGIHPRMQHWARMLFRLRYFEPGHRFGSAMLERVKAGNVLSEKQVVTVKQIYRERGGAEGLRRRQHVQWRLMRLGELRLEGRDRDTVARFAWYARDAAGLRKSKLPVLGALEEKYWRQRREATERRARQIVAMLENDGSLQSFFETHLANFVPFATESGALAQAVSQPLLYLAARGELSLAPRQDSPTKSYFGERRLRHIARSGGAA